MAKKANPNSYIHLELEKLESKVEEFQRYLELNNIVQFKNTQIDEIEEDIQDKLHKEIVIQIKMQDALFSWLPLLEKLKEAKDLKSLETRGNVEVNGMFKNKVNGK